MHHSIESSNMTSADQLVPKNRVEAFTVGVLAIVITIMVLEIKVPHGENWAVLEPLAGKVISYVLSFLFVGIYWNNHHHMMHATRSVDEKSMWANMHLLFWLSLLPFTTGWMGENHFARNPMLLYGMNLMMTALAYYRLARTLAAHHGPESALAKALGADWKGKASLALYAIGCAVAFFAPWAGFLVFTVVAVMWLVPDRRMRRAIDTSASG
jgi:uncharacterized membrane protein